MRTHNKVMVGALLLFMMMAANFHNALNDYGIRSNAFMNGVIASGSNGSGSGTDDPGNWLAQYNPCGTVTVTKEWSCEVNAGIPIPEGYIFVVQIGSTMHYKNTKSGPGTTRECVEGSGWCFFGDVECCLSRTFGICTD